MKKLYLLLSLAILTQPDLLLAKGKNDEDRGNDRPYAQERDDRYNKRGDRRQDDRDYRRERGDDREHRRDRREDRRGDRRDDGNRYQQDGRYPQDDRYQQNYEQGDVRGGKGLPPGLAKKAAAGKPLPPGWQK
ncbi:MAG: hypothetical protein G8345_16420, partial [Magnetococcales bacterium]|nr:hypothetical protein [Magnetococcales bacterium]